MKKILLLGATGSIGKQTINVCKNHKDKFEIVGLSVGKNIKLLEEYLDILTIKHVCTQEENIELINKYPNIKFYYGEQGLLDIVSLEYDLLVNSLVGFVGLKPTLKAIELKRDIALANKETLVVAGQFVIKKAKLHNVNILPIDSEHSAIFQVLEGKKGNDVKRLIITASGGSFYGYTREQLKDVSIDKALSHPTWSMGAKITIDSATMINKGFEVIEAHWLFDIDYNNIDVIIHPQSIIHSLVEYNDNSQIAQLGINDMRTPIMYTLSYPNRLETNVKQLNLNELKTLTFDTIDYNRYPLLKVCYEVGKNKGNAPCILNASNEIANKAFLDGKISFIEIEEIIIETLRNVEYKKDIVLDDIYKYDDLARKYALSIVERINK